VALEDRSHRIQVDTMAGSNPQNDRGRSSETILITKHSRVSSCQAPLCLARQIAKQSRRGPEVLKHTKNDDKDDMLKQNHLQPGDMVSVDQYMSFLQGQLPNTKGKEQKKDQ
jgi:hypothetical protein